MAGTRITILGSLGGQNETQVNGACCRAGTSVALEVAGRVHVIDCGMGTVTRLLQAGVELAAVRHVFITHHHADHNADLATLLTLAHASGAPRITVHGPPPTARFLRELRSLHRPTLDGLHTDGVASFTRRTTANEFAPGDPVEVHRDDAVTVRARMVDHGGMPSVAYRFTTADRDVTFSGDTGGRVSLAAFARGCDTLVHEVIDFPTVLAGLIATQGGASPRFLEHLRDDHSSPEVCGRTATAAGVDRLVLYHLIPTTRTYPDAAWRLQVAPYFRGEVLVASDLLRV